MTPRRRPWLLGPGSVFDHECFMAGDLGPLDWVGGFMLERAGRRYLVVVR